LKGGSIDAGFSHTAVNFWLEVFLPVKILAFGFGYSLWIRLLESSIESFFCMGGIFAVESDELNFAFLGDWVTGQPM